MTESLMLGAYNNVSATELAQHLADSIQLLQDATAALVVRERSKGKQISGIAETLGLSEDRLRKKYPPRDVDKRLADRKRPARAQRPRRTSFPSTHPEWRRPHQRLASALTLMVHDSGVSQRRLAKLLQVDPSYVSRILSGERPASWTHVKTICTACGVEHELLRPLWEVASGVPLNSVDDPATYLRTYLRALHYSVGSPEEDTVLASMSPLNAGELRQALEGPGVPDWDVIAHVVTALKGLPETARPAWRQARTVPATGPIANAFG